MTDWSIAFQKLERVTFKISTDSSCGTAFVVQANNGVLTVATAWHVIESLRGVKDKSARRVYLVSANRKTTVLAHAVGLARLGPEGSDTGILWVGKALTSNEVDRILCALASTDIVGGVVDLSGGGGILEVSGESWTMMKSDRPQMLPRESVHRGMEVGWIGYPRLAPDSLCLFCGRVAACHDTRALYLIDGTGLPGLSGGPMFDSNGTIVGIVSQFIGPDTLTSSGLIAAVPITELVKMQDGFAEQSRN